MLVFISIILIGSAILGFLSAIENMNQLSRFKEERTLFHYSTDKPVIDEPITTQINLPQPGKFEYNIFAEESGGCSDYIYINVTVSIMINGIILHTWKVFASDQGSCGGDNSVDSALYVDEFWESEQMDSGWTKFNVSIISNIEGCSVYIRYFNETIRAQELQIYAMIVFYLTWSISAIIIGPILLYMSTKRYIKYRKHPGTKRPKKISKQKLARRMGRLPMKEQKKSIPEKTVKEEELVKNCPLCGAIVADNAEICDACGNVID